MNNLGVCIIWNEWINYNKMANREKVLRVSNHQYPFGEYPSFCPVRVEERQAFASSEVLLEKKSEMVRKRQMINNPAIIALLHIQGKDNELVYEWEYVPHSFASYLTSKFNPENSAIWEMTRNLLIKKVTYEVTVLMSYLAKMRIETELSMLTLGISHNEKLKLYLSPRSKMGIKSQLFLISQYGQAKQKILRQLQSELDVIQNNTKNNVYKSTVSYPETKIKNEVIQAINLKGRFKSKQKQAKKDDLSRRKMSFGNFQFDSSHFDREKVESVRTPREHKHSFQFNPQSDRFHSDQQGEKEGSLNHRKSIKIELEQKQVMNEKKKRKDSYKVKITTCRQYELEDPSVFTQPNNDHMEEDIFEYFAKKARQEEQEPQSPRMNKSGGANTAPSSPPLSPLLSPKNSQQQNLQQRIREARERSERVLNKIKSMKK